VPESTATAEMTANRFLPPREEFKMKRHTSKPRCISCLASLLAIACVIGAMPSRSMARTQASSIVIANNSSKEIRFVYLSPPDRDDWGPDQLNGSVIHANESFTLSSISCSGSEIKVIAEDQNGCFISATLSCSASANWTLTDSTPADCGG
jgi:hypothetical protein